MYLTTARTHMQIYQGVDGTRNQKGLSSEKQHDAALKVVQVLGKNDNINSMQEVSNVMYNCLALPNVQLWGCIALEAIMARIREKDRLRHFFSQDENFSSISEQFSKHEHLSSDGTEKSGSLSYEEWEQVFGYEGVDKVVLRQLFNEMDANKDNMVHTHSPLFSFSSPLTLSHAQ
jgi:hypothetical protein